ncbi:MAG TPA: CsbD family protein [Roseiflexaceae bacterium]|nr:CsbD family protein [Roseiflexaceae bacterium]
MAGEWDVIKGMWNQLKGEARMQWGRLTDDDWDQIAGNREKLIGRLQEEYGWDRMETERRVDEFFSRYGRDERARSV